MSNTIGFDESFYLSQNPDVAAAVSRGIFTSGAQHYQLNGRFEARNPNAFFNTSFYLAQYPDVARAGINPLTHFLNFGSAEGRFANATEKGAIDLNNNGGADDFNEAAYRAQYSDVDAAIKAGTFKSGYQHFVQFGQFEARVATLSNGTTITGPFSNTGVSPNVGTTFTLTAGTDAGTAFTGTDKNDIFNAGTVLAADGSTVIATTNALDSLNGGGGVDTLRIENTGGVNTLTGTFTNIENLTFLGAGNVNNNANVDVSSFSGEVRLQQTTDTSVTFANVKGQALIADRVANNTAITAVYDAAQTSASLQAVGSVGNAQFNVSGTKLDTVNLTVDKTATGSSITVDDNNATADTVKNVNITASGASTVIATSTVLDTVKVAGAGAVTLTAAAATSIDASASTGGVTVTNQLGTNTAFVGSAAADTITVGATTKVINLGAGNDTVNFTGVLGTSGSVNGGDGVDTIALSAANAATLTANNTFAGTISNFEVLSVGTPAAAAVINLANLNNINTVKVAATGAAGTAEVTTITFGNLAAGQSFTAAGRTVSATGGNLSAADVENAFLGNTVTGATVTGAVTGYTAANNGDGANGVVRFTSTTSGNVDNLTATSNGTAPPAVPTIAVIAQGRAESAPGANDAVTEKQNATFGSLTAGQSLTIDGKTVTASQTLTAAQVETAFLAGGVTGAAVTGNFTNFTAANDAGNTAGVITLTSTSAGTNVSDNTATSSAGTAPATQPTATTVDGTAGADLTFNNFTSGGTLELNGAVTAGITANVKDAGASTNDVFNIVLNGASNLTNTGTVTVANVETINVRTTDSTTASDPTAPSTLIVNDAAATTVSVAGNHGVNFTGSTFTNVTTFDASGVVGTGSSAAAIGTAGAVTFSSSITNKAVAITGGNGDDVLSAASLTDATAKAGATINGGAGNDQITGGNFNDTLNGGDGNDIITGGLGADTMNGGAGNDVFRFNSPSDSTVAARDVIVGFQANTFGNGTAGAAGTGAGASTSWNGDVLRFDVDLGGAINATNGVKVGVLANATDAQTFIQNTFADATPGEFAAALDSSTGTLYVDFNADGNIDSVITLQGVTTITAAAFDLV